MVKPAVLAIPHHQKEKDCALKAVEFNMKNNHLRKKISVR